MTGLVNPFVGTSAATLISSQTITTTPSSVTFAAIPTGFKMYILEIVGSVHTANGHLEMRFNADAGANYNSKWVSTDGAAVTTSQQNGATQIYLNDPDGGGADKIVVDTIFDFVVFIQNSTSASLNKTVHIDGFWKDVNGPVLVSTKGGAQWSPAANVEITEIDLLTSGAGSVFGNPTIFRLWGLV